MIKAGGVPKSYIEAEESVQPITVTGFNSDFIAENAQKKNGMVHNHTNASINSLVLYSSVQGRFYKTNEETILAAGCLENLVNNVTEEKDENTELFTADSDYRTVGSIQIRLLPIR